MKQHKALKITLIGIITSILVFIIGFVIWAKSGYYATEEVIKMYETHSNLEKHNKYTVIKPEQSNGTGIIFYPGAKVEAISYLPLLDKLSDEGYTAILCEMPFNLAVLAINSADDAKELFPEDITEIYMAGHSLGSAMASTYSEDNIDEIDGLILLGGYIHNDYPDEDALTIYGSLDSQEERINYNDNIVVIEGGNHAQYGDYGEQKGDLKASITAEEQQDLTVEAIRDFIESR